MIPLEVRYAVDRSTSIVHKPYADHAEGMPRTSYRGVMATMTDPQPCPDCWPPITTASYWCAQCERQHFEGSAIYEKHNEAGKLVVGFDALAEERATEPEPYFPRPYPED